MKILEVKDLSIPGVKVIQFGRFPDKRGFFSETFKKSDFNTNSELAFMKNFEFVQINVSYSKKGTIRGLHIQWNPSMGKFIKVLQGIMIDLFLDVRKNSPTYGKIGAYKLEANVKNDWNQWIWVPAGIAHGGGYPQDTTIEYLCTSEWSPASEGSISPFAQDLDWSLVNAELKNEFDEIAKTTDLISDKDKNGFSLATWEQNSASHYFTYER